MELVTEVQFTQQHGIYMTGEKVGLSRDEAQHLASRGIVRIIATDRPRVDPLTAAHDAERRAEEARAAAQGAEAEADMHRQEADRQVEAANARRPRKRS